MKPRRALHLATLRVKGVSPITRNPAGKAKAGYEAWKAALEEGAQRARQEMEGDTEGPYSLQVEMLLYPQLGNLGSDLDNYIKDIQDALAQAGVFGPSFDTRSTMKGDERIDHLEMRRTLVSTPEEAGLVAEVWSLDVK